MKKKTEKTVTITTLVLHLKNTQRKSTIKMR